MKLYKRPLILFLSLLSILSALSFSAHGFNNTQQSEKRSLAISETESNSYILAAERTQRKDPLNGFRTYTRGWKISNEHYWDSVGSSATPIFAIAAACTIIFGIIMSFVVCCFCCYPVRSYSYSQTAYTCSAVLLILFTAAAILGCIVLYDGHEKFHESTRSTTNYILKQASDTVSNLRTVSQYMNAAKLIGVDQLSISSDLKLKIDKMVTEINGAANELDSRTFSNSGTIANVLDTVRVTLIIVASATLLLTSLGFLFSICGLQTLIYILVVIGWILIACTLIICGVSLLLHNIVSDTCVAMNKWVQHPLDHTALDDILSCVDPAMATEAIRQTELVTYQIIDILNGAITNLSNGDFPPQSVPLYYNQSGPLVPVLCNPYSTNLSPHTCTTEELQFDNAAQVWKGYICETTIVSGSEICTTTGRLTPAYYNQMAVAVNVTYGLYHYGPYLSDLANCNFVRQTFKSLSDTNCPGLDWYTAQVYIGLLVVSLSVMFSLISLVVCAR